ncbi:MAG: PEP-CTERM system histidine kinase PrsK [Sphingomonadales bacterium]|nr:PEP-CTERM system histidine kinase PrsK [Sphingomonadales bacterium]
MIEAFSIWSHALAAALFGAIAISQLQRGARDWRDFTMLLALAGTSVFALSVAISGPATMAAHLTEHLRNLGWIAFMYMVWRHGTQNKPQTVALVYGAITLILVLLAMLDIAPTGAAENVSLMTQALLRMIMCIGALVLVHNLYTAAEEEARDALRLPMIGFTILWVYDLNLATMAYLTRDWPEELLAARGLALIMAAPLFAIAIHRAAHWRVKLSRTVTLQTVSLAAIGLYLMVMVGIVQALDYLGGERARLAQVSFVFASLLAGLILMPSSTFRAWLRVKIAKHLFKHRYDYRLEWQRFTDTLGQPGEDFSPLDVRVIRALADILESPGGLLIAESSAGMLVQAQWNWDNVSIGSPCVPAALVTRLTNSGRIIEFDSIRAHGPDPDHGEDALIPQWLLTDTRAWVAVPLVHFDRLIGIVILSHPPFVRTLDWEDFDLLRVAARQVASYLAEARGQEALADVKQFDEFNRRFAFIMHDIKNMASQLALVVRNAERHADNPEFRADMIATLKSSTERMNGLLARLSQHNKGRREEPRAIGLRALAERIATQRRALHPVVVMGENDVSVLADPSRLEQALGHLVQNAMEISPASEPVALFVRVDANNGMLDVIDKGAGMSPAFIHGQLFKPFVSTKENGFGVGAFEARTIIAEMGGRLDVTSREGHGTTFSIVLPLAKVVAADKSNHSSHDQDLAA